MKIIYFSLLLALINNQPIFSQIEKSDSTVSHKPDTVAVRGVDWLAYPYIFYSPETNLAFGGGGIVYLINPSWYNSSTTIKLTNLITSEVLLGS
jgi:hypothetical protein